MLKAPDHIKSINPYVPGKPVEELERELGITGSTKLASNENPVGSSPLALRALRKGITGLNRYPDGSCFYLRSALSDRLNVNGSDLIFGNGSNEIIELAVRTFLIPGDEVIMAHPSFAVYSLVVQAVNGKSVVVPLREWRHDLDAMALRITDKTKIIFTANPNNPTGTINTKEEMDSFMKKVPESVLVIVDEAYYEYVRSADYADSMEYYRQGKNMLILRTFSKIYGLAGLRIGYGIAGAEIITEMNKVRQPFNVNTLAQMAALAALSDHAHVERSRRINERGMKYLYRELKALKIHFIPSEANFIYVPLKEDTALQIYNDLLKEGVIVRPMGPRAIRITTGLPAENKKLIGALRKIRDRYN